MFSRGIAILSITTQGVETAVKIKDVLSKKKLNCTIFAPEKYAREGAVPLDKKLSESVREIFTKVDALVAVMATGIIIRTIAPCLKNKMNDPAVVGVDVFGQFATSLLSGHFGGANELTRLIAHGIGAIPVVTTASDVLGKKSADELARLLHCDIENPESLIAINSALVNRKNIIAVLTGDIKVPLNSNWGYEITRAENGKQAIEIANSLDGGIIVTREKIPLDRLTKTAIILRPRKIVVGIGTRKNVSENQVLVAIDSALIQVNIPVERADSLATVNIKKDCPSIKSAAEKRGLNLNFISVDALRSCKHVDLSPDSKLVKRKIGVGGVCERAALIVAGKKGKLILKKTKVDGITVAVAEGT